MKRLFNGMNVKGNIVLAIIVFFVCAVFFQPVADVAKNFSGNVFTFFIDLFYRCAATAQWYDFIMYVALFGAIQFVIKIFNDMNSMRKDLKALSFDINCEQYNDIIVENDAESAVMRVESALLQLEQNINSLTNKVTDYNAKGKQQKWMLNTSAVVLAIIFTFIFTYQCIPTYTKVSFDRAIIKITPYVEAHEIDMLKSNWVLMKSKNDYTAIKDRINFICDEHNLW